MDHTEKDLVQNAKIKNLFSNKEDFFLMERPHQQYLFI